MSISNNLRVTNVSAVICLIGLLLIPSDPKNAFFLGFSLYRLAGISIFLIVITLSIYASYRLSLNSQRKKRLQEMIASTSQRVIVKFAIITGASLIILTCLALLFEIFITSDQFKAQLLVRLSPFIVFLMVSGVQLLFAFTDGTERARWGGIIALAFLTMVGGVILQRNLLEQLGHDYRLNPTLLDLNQIIIAILSWIFYAWAATRPKEEGHAWLLFLGFLLVFFLLQWYTYPRSYWRVKHHLGFLAPAGILSVAILTLAVFEIWQYLGSGSRKITMRVIQIGAIIALILLAIPYFSAAKKHAQILNDSPQYTDQQDYLEFARKAHELDYQYAGKFSQMPLYPFLQALFFQDGMDDLEFFWQGKQVNIILSLFLLGAMFLIFYHYLTLLKAVFLTLMIAFSLYLFKSPYFQSEVLFYSLAFIGFILMVAMIRKPSLLLSISTGVVLGLAHLTKASILPGLAIFVVVFTGIEIIRWICGFRSKSIDMDFARDTAQRLVLLLLSIVCFLVVIYPYIRIANQKFGNYFYNVNTSVYVWYDDFTEAKAVDELYNFADTWSEDILRDEIPTLRTYFQTHSLGQILERIEFGVKSQLNNIWSQYNLTNYLVSYLVLLLFAAFADLKNSIQLVKKWWFLLAFALLYFAIYLAAFTWYSPISPEPRFTYGLFIPAMFAIFVSLREIVSNQSTNKPAGTKLNLSLFVNSANFVIILTLIVNIYLVLSERIYFDRYGA